MLGRLSRLTLGLHPHATSRQASVPFLRICFGILLRWQGQAPEVSSGEITAGRGSPVTRQLALFHAAGMLTPSASLNFAAPVLSSAASESDNTL